MSKLPLEILNAIYSHSNKTTVFQCALTCKSWKESALLFLYKDLSIQYDGAAKLKKLLHLDPIERDRYFQYGSFTKKLVIRFDKAQYRGRNTLLKDSDGQYTKEEWIMLLRYLPNLQVLHLLVSENAIDYLQYIVDSDDPAIMRLKIKEIISGNDLDFFSLSNRSKNTYFAVCYKYRATIATLYVEYYSLYFTMGSINNEMLILLKHFDSLTHLTFYNRLDTELTTLDIMSICPHLISLTYHSQYEFPDISVKDVLSDDTSPKRLNISLKELKLSAPTIPYHYATYLKDYIVPHVDVLKININDIDVFDWMEGFGLDNAVEFLRSLSQVKTASIRWEPYKHYDRETISTESEPTIFYTLLNAMRRGRKLYCTAHYSNFGSVYKSILLGPDDSLYFFHGLKRSDYYLPTANSESEEEPDEEEERSNRTIQFVMPNRFISTIGPEVIHEMNVMMCDTNPNLPLEFLRYALTNCPKLQHFSYKSMNSPDYGIHIGTDPKEISQFVREKKDTSNTIQENIKVIKLKNMKPSNEFLDLMRTYMPATEAFICGLDDFKDQANESFEADLTAFKQLNSVQLSARFLCEKGRDTTFLEIQFLDKNWEYLLSYNQRCCFISNQNHVKTDE